jgi:hypothetical protein
MVAGEGGARTRVCWSDAEIGTGACRCRCTHRDRLSRSVPEPRRIHGRSATDFAESTVLSWIRPLLPNVCAMSPAHARMWLPPRRLFLEESLRCHGEPLCRLDLMTVGHGSTNETVKEAQDPGSKGAGRDIHDA